jgi:hypothetical protein
MKIPANPTSDERNKIIAVAVFAVLAFGLLYYQLKDVFFPSTPSTVVTAPVNPQGSETQTATGARTSAKAAAPGATLDPTLHMEAMMVTESVDYSGSGRNIFSAASAPIAIPKPVASVRVTTPPAPVVQPCPPNCPPPPPPPPIDLTFFGVTISSNGTRQACLLHDDNVYLANAGDIVLRRYKVIAVDAKSIQVEDMQNNNRQTLPLLTN